MKQFYVLEMKGFTEDESQEFLSNILHDVDWQKGQSLSLSHLTEKGVKDLKKHILNEEDSE